MDLNLEELKFVDLLRKIGYEDLRIFIQLVTEVTKHLGISINDERLVFSTRNNKRLILIVGQRDCLAFNLEKKEHWEFIVGERLSDPTLVFDSEFTGTRTCFYYRAKSSVEVESRLGIISETIKNEYNNTVKSGHSKHNKTTFQDLIFNVEYQKSIMENAFGKQFDLTGRVWHLRCTNNLNEKTEKMLTMPFYEKLKESGLVIRYDDDEKIPNNSDLQYKIGDLVVLVVDKKPKAIVKVLESPMKVQSNLDLFKIFNNGGLSIPINQGIYFSKCEWYEPRKEEKFPKYKFDKANRKVVSEDFVGLVFDFWEKRIKINQGTTQILGNSTNDFLYPDESNLILDINLKEGSKQTIHVNKYERNQEARQKCIAHYGPNCQVCNFDFEVMYPSIGQGFIHVHHHKLISNSDGEYIIDPIKDLIPVCPNCHAMLHRKSPDQPYTVNELKNIMGIN